MVTWWRTASHIVGDHARSARLREARARSQQAQGIVKPRARRIGDDRDLAEQIAVLIALGDVLEAVAEGEQVDLMSASRQLADEVIDDQPIAEIERIRWAARDQQDIHGRLFGKERLNRSAEAGQHVAAIERVVDRE